MPIGPFRRRAPVRVQPFYGYRNSERLFLNARALRASQARFEKRSFVRDVATMAGQYLSREVAGLTVELEYALDDGRVVKEEVVTGPEGGDIRKTERVLARVRRDNVSTPIINFPVNQLED